MAQTKRHLFSLRRLFHAITVAGAVVIAHGVNPTTAMDALADVPPDPGTGGTAPVRPFRLDQVRLGGGLLQEKRDRIKRFLREYDERRFLVLFNNQAGRPNPRGVSPPGGWEDGGLLSGHWTGHFMTALSQAYADQGEEVFKTKLDWMVTELAACQDAITARMGSGGHSRRGEQLREPRTGGVHDKLVGRDADAGSDKSSANAAGWVPTHPGYLGALPEDTVLRLGPPRFAVYGSNASTNTWAPWYTQHKIMRGLLDAHNNTNNSQALGVVVRMAEWAHLALTIGDKNHPKYGGNLTRSDLNYMWDTYIAGELGGASEIFPEIYELTGRRDGRHMETAKAFDNRESLFGAAVEDRDILVVKPQNIPGRRRRERLHANTHVPQFLGYLRVYEQGGGADYLAAARNFYGWVVPHRSFASGGTGGNYPGHTDNSELFQNRGDIANALGAKDGAETCTAYNMLKLARSLFMHGHTASYMDYYERGLFNQISGSRADTSSVADPQLTYFQPHGPGSSREYGNTGTCCGGTGMESHTKYQETVYLRSADGSALWVNLYVPSTLTWAERGLSVKQETAFPRGDTARFTIGGKGTTSEAPMDIMLRVPFWVRRGAFRIMVNGEEAEVATAARQTSAEEGTAAAPGTYATLSRTWRAGGVIEVHMPFRIRIERALDRPDTQAIMWGPLLLQLVGKPRGAAGSYWELSLYRYLKRDGDYARAAFVAQAGAAETAAGSDPIFTTTSSGNQTLTARPYYISDAQPVSSYFRRVEPAVVFGAGDAGAPNRKRNDGLPRYDVPVAGIPSPGTDGPTFLDLVWV